MKSIQLLSINGAHLTLHDMAYSIEDQIFIS